MESTNELITKAEANAEGFSIESTNECMTKAEFVANLPTPPQFSFTFPTDAKEIVYIINGSDSSKTIQINEEIITLNTKDVWIKAYNSYQPIEIIAKTRLEHNTNFARALPPDTDNATKYQFFINNSNKIVDPEQRLHYMPQSGVLYTMIITYIVS